MSGRAVAFRKATAADLPAIVAHRAESACDTAACAMRQTSDPPKRLCGE